jgi:hypothetical protein
LNNIIFQENDTSSMKLSRLYAYSFLFIITVAIGIIIALPFVPPDEKMPYMLLAYLVLPILIIAIPLMIVSDLIPNKVMIAYEDAIAMPLTFFGKIVLGKKTPIPYNEIKSITHKRYNPPSKNEAIIIIETLNGRIYTSGYFKEIKTVNALCNILKNKLPDKYSEINE